MKITIDEILRSHAKFTLIRVVFTSPAYLDNKGFLLHDSASDLFRNDGSLPPQKLMDFSVSINTPVVLKNLDDSAPQFAVFIICP